METPEKVLKFFGTIPAINEGGCGIVALSFWRWVEKHCPEELFNISIVYLYYDEEYKRLRDNQAAIITGKFDRIWTPPHIGIMWNDVILEAGGGEVTEFKLWQEVSVDVLLENIKMYWTWNGTFSRFLYIPVIEKELEISLQDVPIAGQLQNS
jgi:hypothetical protein